MENLVQAKCYCIEGEGVDCAELISPPEFCLRRLARYGEVASAPHGCTTGQTWHFEGICLACSGKPASELLAEHIAMLKWLVGQYIEDCSSTASNFQLALAMLFDVADYENTRIILLHWHETIKVIANVAALTSILHADRRFALESTNSRGHSMRLLSDDNLVDGRIQEMWECTNDGCDAYFQLLPRPRPNQARIGGTAVALYCPVVTDHRWTGALSEYSRLVEGANE